MCCYADFRRETVEDQPASSTASFLVQVGLITPNVKTRTINLSDHSFEAAKDRRDGSDPVQG